MLGLPSFVLMLRTKQKSTFFQPILLLVLVLPPEDKKQNTMQRPLRSMKANVSPVGISSATLKYTIPNPSTSPNGLQFTFAKCTQKRNIKNEAQGALGRANHPSLV